MSVATWALVAGAILIAMMLVGTLVARLPLSGAMVYLAIGMLLGPYGLGVLVLDPFRHAAVLEQVMQAALLVSLFSIGLKLELSQLDRRWRAPYRLAFLAMAATVGLIALVGVYGLGLSPGAAILLGGILAPTDPVLASAIKPEPGTGHDPTRFSLAVEGALNDGTAFPLVLLGLGLMQHADLGQGGWRWWAVDLLWSTLGGMAIGTLIGWLVGKLVIYLRTRHHSAVGLDEFLSLGVVAISFGAAQSCLASGFLAVFFAGLALGRSRNFPLLGSVPLRRPRDPDQPGTEPAATHSHHASGVMTRAVLEFNEQLERIAELGIVLLIGAMLPVTGLPASLCWFIPLMFVLVRPVSVMVGMAGAGVALPERLLLGWLGIRGIGSVYYLMFALHHGVAGPLAQQLLALTLGVVAASILVHGLSARPLMHWYQGAAR